MTLPIPIEAERAMKRPVEELVISFMVARGFTREDAEHSVEHYYKMVGEYPAYALAHSAVTDAFRDARVAINRFVQLGFLNDLYFEAKKAEEAGEKPEKS